MSRPGISGSSVVPPYPDGLPDEPAIERIARTEKPAPLDDNELFDELRGAVIDLPVGRILPGWVAKDAVIRMIDRIQKEHEAHR